MSTQRKAPKKAKRVNWREEYQSVVDLFVALSDVHNDTLRNRQTLQLSHDEWLRRAEAAERHNAELLREVEELKARNLRLVGQCVRVPNGSPDPETWPCISSLQANKPRLFGNRLRAFLRSFQGKGLSAGE